MKICSATDCNNRYSGKGLCSMHYAREYRKNNKDKYSEIQKRTYDKNKEKIRLKARENYYANQEVNLANKKRYREENAEKIKEAQREWYLKNRDKAIKKSKAYVESNKDKVKAQRDVHYESNRERLNTKKRADRDRIREVERAWAEANPDKVREKNARRRAMKSNAEYDGWIIAMVWERDKDTCQICMKIVPRDLERSDKNNPLYPHIDHIVALWAGGSHLFSNVRLTHRICNITRTSEQEVEGK